MQQAIAESLERGSSFGRISGDDRSKIWHKPWDKPWLFPYLPANDGDSPNAIHIGAEKSPTFLWGRKRPSS